MLTNEDIARLDDRYVLQDNCDSKHSNLDRRQGETEVKVAVTSKQLSSLIKVLACIGSAVVVALVGIAVKYIWGGV